MPSYCDPWGLGHSRRVAAQIDARQVVALLHESVLQAPLPNRRPPRKNVRVRKGDAVCRRLGRGIWKVLSDHRRRSLVETKMNCIKRLGERVMSRTFERQVNELHIRATILNRFTELGRPQTVAVA